MTTILAVINFISLNGPVLLTAFIGLVSAALAIAMIIPGDQPDKFLQSLLDFLMKFSRKPTTSDSTSQSSTSQPTKSS